MIAMTECSAHILATGRRLRVAHLLVDLLDAGARDALPLLQRERVVGRLQLDERAFPMGRACTLVFRFSVGG